MADDLPPLQCRASRKSGSLSYLELLGPPRPVAGDLYFTNNGATFCYRYLKCKFKIIHSSCSNTSRHMHYNNQTLISNNTTQTCGSPLTCFGTFRPSSRKYSMKKKDRYTSMIQIAIIVLFSVEYFPEDDRKRPKHVGGLPHVCISLFLIMVQLLEYLVF